MGRNKQSSLIANTTKMEINSRILAIFNELVENNAIVHDTTLDRLLYNVSKKSTGISHFHEFNISKDERISSLVKLPIL